MPSSPRQCMATQTSLAEEDGDTARSSLTTSGIALSKIIYLTVSDVVMVMEPQLPVRMGVFIQRR